MKNQNDEERNSTSDNAIVRKEITEILDSNCSLNCPVSGCDVAMYNHVVCIGFNPFIREGVWIEMRCESGHRGRLVFHNHAGYLSIRALYRRDSEALSLAKQLADQLEVQKEERDGEQIRRWASLGWAEIADNQSDHAV
jgi:hypothetical protein